MSTLSLSVLVKAIDGITAPVRRMAASIKRAFEPVVAPIKRVGSSLRDVGRETRRLGLGIAAFTGAAAYGFKRFFVDTAAQFERYQVMLRSLEGSNEKAEASMSWVSDFATRVPYELEDLMNSFVRLRTFGLDPTDGTLQALVDQTAKMGGSAADMQGIILAVGQAWTKQKLQGEEALQLIERGVPVWDLLAERTGIAAAQLQEMASKGELGRGAIRMLIEEMGKSSAGAAQNQAKTWAGMISMISDQWTRFANLVMDSGVFEWMKTRLSGVLEQLNALAASGRLQEIAEQVGTQLVAALEGLWGALKEVWSIARTIGGALVWLRDVFGSWKPVIAGLAIVIAAPLVSALYSAAVAVKALGVALMTTPVGWILAAIAAIAAAVYLIYDNWEPIKEFFAGVWGFVTEYFGASITRLVDMVTGFWESIKSAFSVGFEWLKKAFEYSPLGLLLKGVDGLRDMLSDDAPGATRAASGGQPVAAAGRQEVGGTLKVEVTADGRARVTEMQGRGGLELETGTGFAFAGGA